MARDKDGNEFFIVQHEVWKKPLAKVWLKNGRFAGYFPLHDWRDADWDGKVSWGEYLTSKFPGVQGHVKNSTMAAVLVAVAADHRVTDRAKYLTKAKQTMAMTMLTTSRDVVAIGALQYFTGLAIAGSLAGVVGLNWVTHLVVVKGFEQSGKALVKTIYEKAVSDGKLKGAK